MLQDLKNFRRAPRLLEIDRFYQQYPELICDYMDRTYRIDGNPKEGLLDMGLRMARRQVGMKNVLRDAWTAWRSTSCFSVAYRVAWMPRTKGPE